MLPTYILITPARNEARFIELTVRSMIAQSVPPLKWIIVSDGSTDGTDEIVRKYTGENPWIELLRMPERSERRFAGKVHAFNAGYARAMEFNPDVVGNLDADVSFEADHFEFLLKKFTEDSQLGVFGAPFREGSFQYDYRFTNIENVWGGCQLFRRDSSNRSADTCLSRAAASITCGNFRSDERLEDSHIHPESLRSPLRTAYEAAEGLLSRLVVRQRLV